jgi:hypothetical protein
MLTVAVSLCSSGTGAYHQRLSGSGYRIISWNWIYFVLVCVLMVVNLRGVREASTAFVWPTYIFHRVYDPDHHAAVSVPVIFEGLGRAERTH